MKQERFGCSAFLGKIGKLVALVDRKIRPTVYVKTDSGIEVEVENMPGKENMAEVIARTFKTRKITVGYVDEETGAFKIEQPDQ